MKTLSPSQIAKLRGHKGIPVESETSGKDQGIEFDKALKEAQGHSGIQKEKYIPQSYMKAAKGMEKQFLEYMVKQMKKTVNRQKEPSTAMNYYDSVMTTEQTEALSDKDGGLGIRQMILDQIYPQHMRTEANFKQQQQQKQGFKKYKDNVEMHRPKQSEGFDSVQMKGGDHE